MACMDSVWVYHVCALYVRCVVADANVSYMHYVSMGVLMVGFGYEGYCGEFEDGKNMATKYVCAAG